MNDLADWQIDSWRNFPAVQQPTYADTEGLAAVLAELNILPPLVTSWEVDTLRKAMAAAQNGEAWILQGGDCAEAFSDCQSEPIASKLKVLIQMSLAIIFGAHKKVIRLGRIAGQYAKPRSSDLETVDGITLPSYRGDLINGQLFDAIDRVVSPDRLMQGYKRSALTLNFVRALSEGGFADLHHPENWQLNFKADSDAARRYEELVNSLSISLKFMETIAINSLTDMRRVDFFTSHEALHLEYETALTRPSVRENGVYNLGTHFPWIGDRTRALGGAHLEYIRGIRNPFGIKVGPSMDAAELIELIQHVNPSDEPGRLTLIHRMGSSKIEESLPPLIEAVQKANRRVLWICDPMHGNTRATVGGRKTRHFDDIVSELRSAFQIHRALESQLGGVHLELTGENVTECIGGSRGLTESDLESAYQTQVDPRLNYEQAIEIAFEIAHQLSH
jgi:3-deoxy-7-phosphoheptulonate synthase